MVETKKAIYAHSVAYAKEHGETKAYHESAQLNTDCMDAIQLAIEASHGNTNSYNMKDAVKNVVDQYGVERVVLLMAQTLQNANWDRRYSRENQQWAQSCEIPPGMQGIHSKTHPMILDGFVKTLRKKTSILESIKEQSKLAKQNSLKSPPKTKKEKSCERG